MGKVICCLMLSFLLLSSVSVVWGAEGNQLFAFGAVQKSLGGAGAASPQDATWVIINPATLVDLEKRLDATFELLYINVTAEPRGLFLLSNPFAGHMTYEKLIAVPSFAAVWPEENYTLGFGVIGVAGNSTDFHHPRATLALLTNGDRRAAEQVARFPFSIAHRFDNGWAVGGAIVPAVMRFRTDSFTLKLHTTQGDNKYDEAVGVGFQIGLYRNWDKWALGASYASRTWMTNFPDYEHDLTSWSLDLPQQLQVGVAWRPIDPLQFVLDYKYIEWNAIHLYGLETIHGGLGWKNQNLVKAGVIWDINDKWTARAGISYGNATVNAQHVFANSMTPALEKLHFGLGFSHKFNDHSNFHLTFSMGLPEHETESGRGDLFSIGGKGTKVSYVEHSLTAQYTYEF